MFKFKSSSSKEDPLLWNVFNYQLSVIKEYLHPPRDETYFHQLIEESYEEREVAKNMDSVHQNDQDEDQLRTGLNVGCENHPEADVPFPSSTQGILKFPGCNKSRTGHVNHQSPDTLSSSYGPLTPLSTNSFINDNCTNMEHTQLSTDIPWCKPVNYACKEKLQGKRLVPSKENKDPAKRKGKESLTKQMRPPAPLAPLSCNALFSRNRPYLSNVNDTFKPFPSAVPELKLKAKEQKSGLLKENRCRTNLKRKDNPVPRVSAIPPATENRPCKKPILNTLVDHNITNGRSNISLKARKDKGKMAVGNDIKIKQYNYDLEYTKIAAFDSDDSEVFSDQDFREDVIPDSSDFQSYFGSSMENQISIQWI